MGYKNNWHRDNVETRQVTWSNPLGDEPVAIIGGGISGLACAQVSALWFGYSAWKHRRSLNPVFVAHC
jgi:hypothetical protein